ncbi:MAG: hypothetical protein WB554_20150 [Desulfomonilaceae bacterium]
MGRTSSTLHRMDIFPNQGIAILLMENHRDDKSWEIIIGDKSMTIKKCFFSGTRAEMEKLFNELQERYTASEIETS